MEMYKYINKCINQKYLSLTVIISISFVMIFVKKKHLLYFVKLSSFYSSFTEIKSQIDAKKQYLSS